MDSFYDRSGREISLVRQPGKLAVRLVRGRTIANLPRDIQTLLAGAQALAFFPEYGLQVFKIAEDGDGTATTHALRLLNAQVDVQSATPVFRRAANGGFDIIVNNQVAVELKDTTTDSQFNQLNQENRVTVVRPLPYVRRGYLLATRDGDGELGPIEVARKYFESGLVVYATPDLIQPRVPRQAPTVSSRSPSNPVPAWRYQNEQWHLNAAKICDAWQVTLGVDTITIAIADDGVDIGHIEFAGKIVSQFDFSTGIPDGKPKLPQDRHGTACAGVATAKGLAAYGAAPRCRLMPVRFPEQMGSVLEGDMFHWMADNGADVISCSWGPPDGRTGYYPLPDNVASAIQYCVTNGRHGLGIPVFWAAGNGNEQISTDGYASNPDVITVGASTEADTKAPYSDFGNELSFCAPSSGDATIGQRAIVTTDRSGMAGYNPDTNPGATPDLPDIDYTDTFGGTSSAAPLAAGVAALLLSVNPGLRAIDVRDILQKTADKIGSVPYNAQGRNGIFGFGRVNARAAVDEAIRRVGAPINTGISITGPAAVARDGPPLEFRISAPAGKFFAVEVAARAQLFGPEKLNRTIANFFASWGNGTLSTGVRYGLPAGAWAVLRQADVLFYRLLLSDSSTAWVNVAASTTGADFASAPSVMLTGGNVAGHPTIVGPTQYSRNAASPAFQVDVRPHFYYAVEVATQPTLFASSAAPQRSSASYFATWTRAPSFFAEPTYRLPDDVWQALKGAGALFYRVWANDAGGRWQNPVPSATNESPLPSIQLTA
jgi:subtilisin family serine protease